MAEKANEEIIDIRAVYTSHFVENNGQQVMVVFGYGEDTNDDYVRKNGEWVKPEEGYFRYPHPRTGEFFPGEIYFIKEDSYEEALKFWDAAEKDQKPVYEDDFDPYIPDIQKNTI